MKVFNLASEVEMIFDDKTSAVYGVAYAYCEENNLLSWLFEHCWDLNLDDAYRSLPITQGSRTVACGDWAARI